MDGLQDTKSHHVVFNMPRKFVICSFVFTELSNSLGQSEHSLSVIATHNGVTPFVGRPNLGSFVWCPGHVGIQGHEKSNAEARHATDSPYKSMHCHTI